MLRRANKVVSSTLGFTQALPANALPSHRITLAMSKNKISEMKNGQSSELRPLERPPCPMLLTEAKLVSMVHTATRDHVDVQ